MTNKTRLKYKKVHSEMTENFQLRKKNHMKN